MTSGALSGACLRETTDTLLGRLTGEHLRESPLVAHHSEKTFAVCAGLVIRPGLAKNPAHKVYLCPYIPFSVAIPSLWAPKAPSVPFQCHPSTPEEDEGGGARGASL